MTSFRGHSGDDRHRRSKEGSHDSEDSWERKNRQNTRVLVDKFRMYAERVGRDGRARGPWARANLAEEQDRHQGLYSPECSVTYTMTPNSRSSPSHSQIEANERSSSTSAYMQERLREDGTRHHHSSLRRQSPLFPSEEDREVFDIFGRRTVYNEDDEYSRSPDLFKAPVWQESRRSQYSDEPERTSSPLPQSHRQRVSPFNRVDRYAEPVGWRERQYFERDNRSLSPRSDRREWHSRDPQISTEEQEERRRSFHQDNFNRDSLKSDDWNEMRDRDEERGRNKEWAVREDCYGRIGDRSRDTDSRDSRNRDDYRDNEWFEKRYSDVRGWPEERVGGSDDWSRHDMVRHRLESSDNRMSHIDMTGLGTDSLRPYWPEGLKHDRRSEIGNSVPPRRPSWLEIGTQDRPRGNDSDEDSETKKLRLSAMFSPIPSPPPPPVLSSISPPRMQSETMDYSKPLPFKSSGAFETESVKQSAQSLERLRRKQEVLAKCESKIGQLYRKRMKLIREPSAFFFSVDKSEKMDPFMSPVEFVQNVSLTFNGLGCKHSEFPGSPLKEARLVKMPDDSQPIKRQRLFGTPEWNSGKEEPLKIAKNQAYVDDPIEMHVFGQKPQSPMQHFSPMETQCAESMSNSSQRNDDKNVNPILEMAYGPLKTRQLSSITSSGPTEKQSSNYDMPDDSYSGMMMGHGWPKARNRLNNTPHFQSPYGTVPPSQMTSHHHLDPFYSPATVEPSPSDVLQSHYGSRNKTQITLNLLPRSHNDKDSYNHSVDAFLAYVNRVPKSDNSKNFDKESLPLSSDDDDIIFVGETKASSSQSRKRHYSSQRRSRSPVYVGSRRDEKKRRYSPPLDRRSKQDKPLSQEVKVVQAKKDSVLVKRQDSSQKEVNPPKYLPSSKPSEAVSSKSTIKEKPSSMSSSNKNTLPKFSAAQESNLKVIVGKKPKPTTVTYADPQPERHATDPNKPNLILVGCSFNKSSVPSSSKTTAVSSSSSNLNPPQTMSKPQCSSDIQVTGTIKSKYGDKNIFLVDTTLKESVKIPKMSEEGKDNDNPKNTASSSQQLKSSKDLSNKSLPLHVPKDLNPSLSHSDTKGLSKPSLPQKASEDLSKPSLPQKSSEDLSKPSLPQKASKDLSKPSLPQKVSTNLSKPSLPQKASMDLSKPSLPQKVSKDLSKPSLPQKASTDLSKTSLLQKASKALSKTSLLQSDAKDLTKPSSSQQGSKNLSKTSFSQKVSKDLSKTSLSQSDANDLSNPSLSQSDIKDLTKPSSSQHVNKDLAKPSLSQCDSEVLSNPLKNKVISSSSTSDKMKLSIKSNQKSVDPPVRDSSVLSQPSSTAQEKQSKEASALPTSLKDIEHVFTKKCKIAEDLRRIQLDEVRLNKVFQNTVKNKTINKNLCILNDLLCLNNDKLGPRVVASTVEEPILNYLHVLSNHLNEALMSILKKYFTPIKELSSKMKNVLRSCSECCKKIETLAPGTKNRNTNDSDFKTVPDLLCNKPTPSDPISRSPDSSKSRDDQKTTLAQSCKDQSRSVEALVRSAPEEGDSVSETEGKGGKEKSLNDDKIAVGTKPSILSASRVTKQGSKLSSKNPMLRVKEVQSSSSYIKEILAKYDLPETKTLYVFKNDLLLRRCSSNGKKLLKIVIPEDKINEIILIAHTEFSSHGDVDAVFSILKRHFFLTNKLKEFVKKIVDSCLQCSDKNRN